MDYNAGECLCAGINLPYASGNDVAISHGGSGENLDLGVVASEVMSIVPFGRTLRTSSKEKPSPRKERLCHAEGQQLIIYLFSILCFVVTLATSPLCLGQRIHTDWTYNARFKYYAPFE